MAHSDWQGIDLVHAELGGGRLAEFHALKALRERFPSLPLSATVHDPERLVWRRASLPWPLSLATRLPSPLPQIATVLTDPLCLHEEKQLARSLTRLITLTHAGGACLRQRMGLRAEQMVVIPHGNPGHPRPAAAAAEPVEAAVFRLHLPRQGHRGSAGCTGHGLRPATSNARAHAPDPGRGQ